MHFSLDDFAGGFEDDDEDEFFPLLLGTCIKPLNFKNMFLLNCKKYPLFVLL